LREEKKEVAGKRDEKIREERGIKRLLTGRKQESSRENFTNGHREGNG